MPDMLSEKYAFNQFGAGVDADLDVRPEHYKAFAVDDQVRPSNALIDFWFASGNQRAISYNHLYDVAWNRSEGLVLTFSDHKVTLRGHGLEALYRGLKRHRIVYVWEASSQEAITAADNQPVVTAIDIQPRTSPVEFANAVSHPATERS